MRKLVLNYARYSLTHPGIKCDTLYTTFGLTTGTSDRKLQVTYYLSRMARAHI
jgi:hypothetical protein